MYRATACVAAIIATTSATYGSIGNQYRHRVTTSHTIRSNTYVSGNGGHQRHVFYGVGNGGEAPRTTATGGNSGGYSNKN